MKTIRLRLGKRKSPMDRFDAIRKLRSDNAELYEELKREAECERQYGGRDEDE